MWGGVADVDDLLGIRGQSQRVRLGSRVRVGARVRVTEGEGEG